jgi:hypothetical protein
LKYALALIAATLIAAETSRVVSGSPAKTQIQRRCPDLINGVRYYRGRTWHWQDRRGVPRTVSYFKERYSPCNFVKWSAKLWRHRAHVHWTMYVREEKARKSKAAAVVGAFLCIHSYEGPWNANTGNGYYGGLQMDLTFQRNYGSEFLRQYGTADQWPPGIQLLVASRARDGYNGIPGRAYQPWPNTARMCGVL